MSTNLNVLLSSATALVFRSLGQIEVDAAQMGITGQTLMGHILETEPEIFKAGLQISNQQAADEIQQGWVKFGENLGSAVTTFATIGIGSRIYSEPESPANVKVDVEEEGAELADLSASDISDDDEAVLEGNNEETVEAGAEDKAQKKAEKDYLKAQDRVQINRGFVNTTIAPQLANVISSGFEAGSGYVQAKITKDQAMAQYIQGYAQLAGQVVSQTNENIQGNTSREQAAAQAFLQAEQLANSRG